MTSTRNLLISGLIAIVIAGLFGTAAFALLGQRAPGTPGKTEIHTGTGAAPAAAGDYSTRSALGNAPAPSSDAANGAGAGSSYAYPYKGGGPFQPGPPPFGPSGGASADGVSAWGVAYQKTTDANAKPGADLIKAAYEDAKNQAKTLASATGVSLGKVLALNDFTMNQPYYMPCVQPLPAQGAPPPAQGAPGASGQGEAQPGTIVAPGRPIVQPFPAPAPCNPDHYLVAWVMVRFAIA